MAKKITDAESGVLEQMPATEPAAEPVVEIPEPPQQEKPKETTAPSAKKPKTETGTAEIPDFADKILKAYPNYQDLYIDNGGGTFTIDTPPVFLSNATLYRNPYFKP